MARQSGAYNAHPTSRDDVCLIAFTSGTTGKPKGTMHFHRDVLAMCDLFPRHILQMNENDVVCGTPPIAFTFGLGGLLAFPLRYGASTVLLEKHTPETLMQTIAKYRATQCYTAPTMYRQMATLAKGVDLSSLKHPVSAGEALPDATRQLWKQATGIEMTDGIGGTEVIHIYISSAGAQVRPGSIGQVVPGYVAQIVGDDMQPLPPGTVGRLAVRGPTGCKYLADPRQQDYVKDGWNLPGDTFVMDAEGYFSYQARNDDMIISAGYNIAGPEVESALLQHPAVAECGVVGHARRRPWAHRAGLCRAQARPHGRCGHGKSPARARQANHRPVQVPAQGGLLRRLAPHRDRQTAALQAASNFFLRSPPCSTSCNPKAGHPPKAMPTASKRVAAWCSSRA